MNVTQIKAIVRDLESNGLDDLILAKVTLQGLFSGYDQASLEIPEWVVDGINLLDREIGTKSRADLMRKLKNLEAQQEADMPKSERRKMRQEEIDKIKQTLAK